MYLKYTKRGYNVFFAPESLRGESGETYEAGIYQAIMTAKVMIVLGTKKEYFESTWPKSEWMRYLENREENGGLLLPVFGGEMRWEDVPSEMRNLGIQGLKMDSGTIYAEVEILIDRHLKLTESREAVPHKEEEPPIEYEKSLELAMLYYQDGAAQNQEEAFRQLVKASMGNLPEAWYLLAECYNKRKGTKEDMALAAYNYKRAADSGYAAAQFVMGIFREKGIAMNPDHAEAQKWFEKAAIQGHAEAQYRLGCIYLDDQSDFDNGAVAQRPQKKIVSKTPGRGSLLTIFVVRCSCL